MIGVVRGCVQCRMPARSRMPVYIRGAAHSLLLQVMATIPNKTLIQPTQLQNRQERDAWVVADQGDLDFHNVKATGHDPDAPHGSSKRQDLVGHANRLIYEAAHRHGRDGALALTLGGDHSIGVGSVAGALKARPETAVIWVDAHADINSPKVRCRALQGMHACGCGCVGVYGCVWGWEWKGRREGGIARSVGRMP
jgi:hypothetical protein